MNLSSNLLSLQSALESTDGSIASDARNASMVGASQNSNDPDIALEQTKLIKFALEPLTASSPSSNWAPFAARDLPATAFLAIAQDETQSLVLRVLSCPLPIPGQSPHFMMNVSGPAAFTRTSNPITAAAFASGDIEFTKIKFAQNPAKLCSVRLPLSAAGKRKLSLHLGDDYFNAIRDPLPFRTAAAKVTPFSSPTRSQRNRTSIALPICWPLPCNHTVTLADDIPLPKDAAELQIALTSFNCGDSAWLTENPVLDLWLQAAHLEPEAFLPETEAYFSLNDAESLEDYQTCIAIARSIMADSMLVRNKPALRVAYLADPSILHEEVFPPPGMPESDLCAQTINPALPWTPVFSFTAPPSYPLKSSTLEPIPTTLIAVPESDTSTVSGSTSSLLPPIPRKLSPAHCRWMAFLLCDLPSSVEASPPIFPRSTTVIKHTPRDPLIALPTDTCIMSPLHETFEAHLKSKSTREVSQSMSHRFELSRSSNLPNIVTEFLLHCGPQHGAFFSSQVWDTILSGHLCAAPLSSNIFHGFSPLLTLLLNPDHGSPSTSHPVLPSTGFASFLDVLRFLNGCKWFLMTISHPKFYDSTIVFRGLAYLEHAMKENNLAARWQEPTIRTAPASYQVLELVHNLFAAVSATASNIPPSCFIPTLVSNPVATPSFLISPTINDATLTIDLHSTLRHWKVSCNSVLQDLCGSASSLTSLLQAAHPVSLSHYLFRSSKKRPAPTLPSDRARPSPPAPTTRNSKRKQADSGKAILQPAGTFTIQDLLKLKQEGKLTPPRLPKMQGLRNPTGVPLCLSFLLGQHCESAEYCGFHLQAQPAAILPGTSSADYKPFRDWVKNNNTKVALTQAALNHSKLGPTP